MLVQAPHRHPEAGFSLVEMLVALMIIALASVMVVMTVPRGDEGPLDRNAERLGALLAAMPSEAIALGRPVGLDVSAGEIRKLAWQNGAWVPLTEKAFKLEPRLRLNIRGARKPPVNWPAVTVDEMGVFSPATVEIVLGVDSRTYHLSAAGLEEGGAK